jgi:HlyD family secretion protein
MSISPDSQTDPQLGQVYRARVKLDRNYVTKEGQKVFFKAGQTANAEIVTRDRRIVDVLLDPIKQIQNDVNL